jgi:hypothetical protein
VCAPGFSLLLAAATVVGGAGAVFWVTPIAGALLVWMTFLAGRTLSRPVAGAMAAVLIAASPPVLYQVVQPMNDVTTAALWMTAFVALMGRRWVLAGVCCGLALLVRPNLLPLGVVAGLYVVVAEPIPNPQSLIPRVVRFGVGVLPFASAVLWLNHALYGSPFRSGYGQLGQLFAVSNASFNAPQYLRWLVETHTVFPLLSVMAPFFVTREKRPAAWLAWGIIVATCTIYFFYTPFDDWSYLRFLMPAIAMMVVLASVLVVRALDFITRPGNARAGEYIVMGVAAGLAAFCVRTATERHAFSLQFLEQRYRSAGSVVRSELADDAVVLSVWDSGAVRFHGRREAVSWEALDPAWLDRSLAWLEERGHTPYMMFESWEEPRFRGRFGLHSDIGKLDWPPKYEVDRVVRIYDPRDRERYLRGEHVNTKYLWPLRR